MKKLILGTLLAGFATVSHATPMATFIIDGDTFSQPFAIANNSTDNEDITRVVLDLSGTGVVFDTVTGGAPNWSAGLPFSPVGSDAAITGLTAPAAVDDGSAVLDMLFSDFNVGETFRWDIDVDFSPGSVTVEGDDLIGAMLSIDFSNGERVFGALQAVTGNSNASQFVATGTTTIAAVPEPASLALLGMGAMAFGFAGRRRRKSL